MCVCVGCVLEYAWWECVGVSKSGFVDECGGVSLNV